MIYIYLGKILSLSCFLGDLHPVKEFCHLALSMIYIPLRRILSLSRFLGDLHLVKEFYHLASLVIYIRLGGILSLNHFFYFFILVLHTVCSNVGWIALLLLYFKCGYNCFLHLLMILLQMLNVPWLWQFLPVHRLQVITALSWVMDDPVGSFPGWTKLPLGWILSSSRDFA